MSDLRERFERAWPLLEPAVAPWKQYTKQNVFDEIASGRNRLIVLEHSAFVNRFWTYPSGRKSFQCWLVGGDLDEIVDWTNNDAVDIARDKNCDELRMIGGRRGFIRALDNGWREAGTIAIKDIR